MEDVSKLTAKRSKMSSDTAYRRSLDPTTWVWQHIRFPKVPLE
jgi:hypothetical protein